jgi:hypothetical protein
VAIEPVGDRGACQGDRDMSHTVVAGLRLSCSTCRGPGFVKVETLFAGFPETCGSAAVLWHSTHFIPWGPHPGSSKIQNESMGLLLVPFCHLVVGHVWRTGYAGVTKPLCRIVVQDRERCGSTCRG